MHHARPIALALIATIAASCVAKAADPETYALDPVHTRVMFAISHAGFSNAIGTVSGSTGTLVFDRNDWRSARLDVCVPLTRLDLGDEKWNAAALATNLLDAARHPAACFVSETVEPADAEHARVCGKLTLRGVARPVCMDVVLNALKRHPMPPFRRTAGFSATATLSRSEYGIDAWQSLIGDSVELRIEAEAVRSNQVAGTANEPVEGALPEPQTVPSNEPASEPEPSPEPVP